MAKHRRAQPLGINDLGRIGELCIWRHAAPDTFRAWS